jgi:hypothetical protein
MIRGEESFGGLGCDATEEIATNRWKSERSCGDEVMDG